MRSIIKAYLIKLIAAFSILVFIMPQGIAAAESLKLSASSEKGDIGDQVIVTVKAENAVGTEGGQFLLSFDSTIIRPVSVEAGELIAKAVSLMQMGNLEYAPGQLIYMWVTVYGDTADSGNVCKIKFDLLKEGETLLRFDEIVVVPDSIGTTTSVPGKITISVGAMRTEPEESELAEPDQDEDDPVDLVPVDLVNDRDVNDFNDINDDSGDESINENADERNLSLYAIGLVVLVFLLTIGFGVIRRLKNPDLKRKK